jgi:uncharacterized protein
MGKKTALRAMSVFAESGLLASPVSIFFYGGEPLLGFSSMVNAVDASYEVLGRDNVTFLLFTNASVLTQKMENFLVDHGFEVQVSLDGPSDVQNLWRPLRDESKSYNRVVKHALRLQKRLPNDVRISAVMGPEEQYLDCWRIYEHILNLGFKRVSLSPCDGVPKPGLFLQKHHSKMLIESLDVTASRYLERIGDGRLESLHEFVKPMTFLFARLKTRYPWLGGMNPCVCSNGDIYPWCEAVCCPSLKVGNVHDRVDFDLLREHVEATSVDRVAPCRNCWARYICGGCNYPISLHYENGLVLPLEAICDATRREVELGAMLFYRLNESNPTALKQLIGFRQIRKRVDELISSLHRN